MNTLRWLLGVTGVLSGGGYLALFFVSNGFRRSFGASENHALVALLPLAAAGVLCAGLAWPAQRILLHGGAVVAVSLIGACAWQVFAESAGVLWFGILYLALWLFFYGSAIGRAVVVPGNSA